MDAAHFGPYRVTAATRRRPSTAPWPPRYSVAPRIHECLRAIERADHELRGIQVGDRHARRLAERALARNAWGTASIEGNPMTLAEVESLLASQATPDARMMPTEREILNTARFIEGMGGWEMPRRARDILPLHATLMEGVLADAGEFKRVANFVGRREDMSVVYVATAHERVKAELDAALAWYHDAPEHPLVKAFILFHEFQAIHPFRDGNGRVGRALHTIALATAGYQGVRLATIDASFNEDRDGYYGALAAAEGDWDRTPWLAYMAGVARDAFVDAARLAMFGRALPASLNERQATLADWFGRGGERSVKFADVHAAFPTIAERTLKRDLAALREAGIVVMRGERKGATYTFA